ELETVGRIKMKIKRKKRKIKIKKAQGTPALHLIRACCKSGRSARRPGPQQQRLHQALKSFPTRRCSRTRCGPGRPALRPLLQQALTNYVCRIGKIKAVYSISQ